MENGQIGRHGAFAKSSVVQAANHDQGLVQIPHQQMAVKIAQEKTEKPENAIQSNVQVLIAS